MTAQARVKSTVASRRAGDGSVRGCDVYPDIAHATWRSSSVNFSTEQDSSKEDKIIPSATSMTTNDVLNRQNQRSHE